MGLLRRESIPFVWRAAYGWEWQEDQQLDGVQDFRRWNEAAHWLRQRIAECTTRPYAAPQMIQGLEYVWTSPIGQEFSIWREYTE